LFEKGARARTRFGRKPLLIPETIQQIEEAEEVWQR
jgi:hypothetical protein